MEPTQQEIDELRAAPAKAAAFEAKYGAGTSVNYMQAAPDVPDAAPLPVTEPQEDAEEAPAEEEQGRGVMGTLADMVRGAGHGIQEAANQGINSLESFDVAASKKLDEMGIPSRLQIFNQEGEFDPALKTFADSEGDTDWLGGKTTETGDAAQMDVIKHPVTAFGSATSSVTQFIAGFAGTAKVTGVRGIVGGFLNGAITDSTFFDPEEGNLSNLMAETGWAVPIMSEALATDPQDPEWMNRMRNATEGVILGGAVEGTLKGIRAIALARKARETGDEALAGEARAMADEAQAEAEDIIANGAPIDSPQAAPTTQAQGGPSAQSGPLEAPSRETLVDEKALKDALADTDNVTLKQIDESLWFNADKMDGPLEGQVMIEVMGDALARSGALEKLGIDRPETFDAVLKGAKEEIAGMVGTGVEAFTDRLAQVSSVAMDQSKFLVAGKMALQTTGREISRYATRLDGMAKLGKSDPDFEAKFLDLMQTHANLQGHLKAVQTAAARATSAGRIVTNDGLDTKALERVQAAGGSKAVRDMAAKLAATGGPAQQAKLIRAMNRRKTGPVQVINEVFINSILSGWGTHAVNMVSNTMTTALLPMERVIGGALTRSPEQVRAGLRQYAELRGATVDGLRAMGRVLRTESPVLDNEIKLDMHREGFRAIATDRKGAAGALINGIGSVIRLPGRALMAEDEFFKQVNFRSRLRADLMVTAESMSPTELKKLGYKDRGEFLEGETDRAVMSLQSLDDKWSDLVAKGNVVDDAEAKEAFIRNNIGSANEASPYSKAALHHARESTFTTPLAPDTISAGWQKMANRHPILRQITPFIQTPVNILNKAFDRTPGVNLLRTRYRTRLQSPDPAVRAQAAGEMATGVAISSGLMLLVNEGRITGGGPSDGGQRENWMRDKNWQPYSLNVGTTENPEWVAYNRMDPYFFAFGVAGDITEMMQASQNDPSFDAGSLMAMLTASVANNLTSKTWLQGISDVVEVLQSKDRPDIVDRWMQQRTAAMVPFSSLNRTYNREMDDVSREARSYVDNIKGVTPGMSGSLPGRYDWVTGQTIENPSNLLGFLRHSKGDGNTVNGELRRLGYGFSGPDRRIGEIRLSSEQFQDWNRMMGTVRIAGRTLSETLERAMQSERYDLSRERIADGITTPGESHRKQMLAPIIAAYKQASRSLLLQGNPDLLRAWQDAEIYKRRAKAGQAGPEERKNLILNF